MSVRTINISIPKELINKLPVVQYPGVIHLIDTEEDALAAIETINQFKVIGFDTETKPNFKKGSCNGVALIQISTGDECYLFRVNKLGFIKELRDLFSNAEITKIGLSIHDDFKMLGRLHQFEATRLVDLQHMVKDYGIKDNALQRIYAILFNQRISKGQRLSNWEADVLTPAQMEYAAIDAWATLRIFNYLKEGNFDPDSCPYKIEIQEETVENPVQ